LTSIAIGEETPSRLLEVWRGDDKSEADTYGFFLLESLVLGVDSKDGNLSFSTSARIKRDFSDKAFDMQFHLAYLDFQEGRLSMRLGRQYTPNEVGFFNLDGMAVGYSMGRFRPKLYGGVTESPFSLNDDREGIVGGELETALLNNLLVASSLLSTFSRDDIKKAIVGVQIDNRPRWLVQGPKASVYGKLNFDIISGEIVDVVGIANFFALPSLQLSVEYRFNQPQFPEESIFWVLLNAVGGGAQKAASLSLKYDFLSKFSLYANYDRILGEFPVNQYYFDLTFGATPNNDFLFRFQRIQEDNEEFIEGYNRLHCYVGQKFTPQFSTSFGFGYDNKVESEYFLLLDARHQVQSHLFAYLRMENTVRKDTFNFSKAVVLLRYKFGSTWFQ